MMPQPVFDKPPIIIEPPAAPRAACIWLHGLGADGYDFEPLVHALQLTVPVRFILPHAPLQPVTVNGRLPMRAWFDIRSPVLDADVDAQGITHSSAAIAQLAHAQGVPVMLAGFSQGGLIALHTALHENVAAGVIALSTWYPFAPPETHLPILMAHGEQDEIVPLALAQQSAANLQQAGAQLTWQTWPMGHTVIPAEVGAVNRWLNQQLEKLDG